ncbi:MAG: glutamate racemase [Patescibacteria group bacterium]
MIGIFDSGIGGLTVVKEVFNILPDYQIAYFGDTARTPYGTKGDKTIVKYAQQDAEFLVQKGAKILIVACNTASAVAYDQLRQKFYLPVFEVITPAVRKAIAATANKRVGVIGTQATIASGIYERLINQEDSKIKVMSVACPLLVPLVEENWLTKPETKRIAKKYLKPLKNKQIDTLILGCTHYPLLKEMISQIMGKRVTIIDPAHETAQAVKEFLAKNQKVAQNTIKGSEHQFYVSDITPKNKNVAQSWLGRKIELIEINIE